MNREYILEGGGLEQLALAWRVRRAGADVLLLVPETFLGREICAPGRYLLEGEDLAQEGDCDSGNWGECGSMERKLWEEWMVPEVWDRPGQLHPDRLKSRLVDLCVGYGFW